MYPCNMCESCVKSRRGYIYVAITFRGRNQMLIVIVGLILEDE